MAETEETAARMRGGPGGLTGTAGRGGAERDRRMACIRRRGGAEPPRA